LDWDSDLIKFSSTGTWGPKGWETVGPKTWGFWCDVKVFWVSMLPHLMSPSFLKPTQSTYTLSVSLFHNSHPITIVSNFFFKSNKWRWISFEKLWTIMIPSKVLNSFFSIIFQSCNNSNSTVTETDTSLRKTLESTN